MGRLLFGIVMLAMLCIHTPAFSQDKIDEFEAFRSKLNKSKGGGADASTPTPNASGIVSPDEDDDENAFADPLGGGPAPAPGQSPLGAAGALPIGKAGGGGGFGIGATPQTPEELQALMEQEQEDAKRKMEEQVFNQALKTLMPLKPEQIRKTMEQFRITREATETPIVEPEPRMEVVTASLDPSAAPVMIKTAPNTVTTVSILDATGMPWPVMDLTFIGPYTVMPPEDGGNLLRIIPRSSHGTGNISMRLVDMITPVMLRMQTGLDWVHYRLDIRIPKAGPLAKTPIIEYGGLKAVAGKDQQLVSVLEGTAPADAEKMVVDGADGRTSAWNINGRTYLRTPLTLLSPAWDASVTSADGTTVYSLENAPVVILSDEGRMVKAKLLASNEVTQ